MLSGAARLRTSGLGTGSRYLIRLPHATRGFQKNALKNHQRQEVTTSRLSDIGNIQSKRTSKADIIEIVDRTPLNLDNLYEKIGSKTYGAAKGGKGSADNRPYMFSSPNDSVNTLNFDTDYQLWNLFYACLKVGDYTRADELLISIRNSSTYQESLRSQNNKKAVYSDTSSASPIILNDPSANYSSISAYIQGFCALLDSWSLRRPHDHENIKLWFSDKISTNHELRQEPKVFASMLHALNNTELSKDDLLFDFINYFQVTNGKILENAEIIGFQNLRDFFKKVPYLVQRIPEKHREFIESLLLDETGAVKDDIDQIGESMQNSNQEVSENSEGTSLGVQLNGLKKEFLTEILDQSPEEEESLPMSAQQVEHQESKQTSSDDTRQNDSLHYDNTAESSKKSVSKKIDFDLDPGSIKSEIEDLLSVQSLNIKALRHSLLGLGSDNEELYLKELSEKFPELNDSIPTIESKGNSLYGLTIDFFSLKKQLSPERQIEFEEFLDGISEARERKLEECITDVTRQKWEHEFESLRDKSLPLSVEAYMFDWHKKMVPLLKQQIDEYWDARNQLDPQNERKLTDLEKKNYKSKLSYGPFLSLLKPEKLATITLLELMKLFSVANVDRGVTTVKAVTTLGKAVELEYKSEQILSREIDVYKNFKGIKKTPEFKKFLRSKRAQELINSLKEKNKNITEDYHWDTVVSTKVGSALLSVALKVVKIEMRAVDPKSDDVKVGLVPALYHTYEHVDGAKVGVIKTHPKFGSQLGKDRLNSTIPLQNLPMVCKPRPWTSYRSGGYLCASETLLKTKRSAEQNAYIKAASENQKLDKIFNALNNISLTPWTINRKLLETITTVWNTGEEFLEIPNFSEELVLPPKPALTEDPSVLYDYKVKAKRAANKFAKDRSVRCDTNYKLEIARALVGERIYFPYSLDFRGRSYPIPSLLNHLGNDLSRSLLIFWNGKPLGESGVRWLKIHLCNLMGFDKLPLEERVAFTDNHIEDIIDSAENPLNGKGWWKTADKPWQALSACLELSQMYQMDDPTQFISHQPVHQDGTCNGLQHYAALGGDYEGANQVNLIPKDRPSDVYTHVSQIVQNSVNEKAAKGDENALIAQKLITRKLVKQTVMTSVYGVTYIGAKDQIAKRLEEATDLSEETIYQLAAFLTKEVFAAIRSLFTGAHEIQDWFEVAAHLISKSIRLDVKSRKPGEILNLSSVIWTTPLGLPVVQPYRVLKKKIVETNLQTITIGDPNETEIVDSRKQVSAFPPNYIHSLDATHMLMSATSCSEKGLDFAAVHDSYWTHACDIAAMNESLRAEFVKLHTANLVEKLKNEFERRYEGFVTIKAIEKSSPLAQKIIAFRKQFNKNIGRTSTLADEIEFERERYSSLRSEIKANVEFGKSMQTSISILTEEDIEFAYESKEGKFEILLPFRLPKIPKRGDFDVSVVKQSTYFFS